MALDGKPINATHAVLSLAGGKVELWLRLTPRLVDPGATFDGKPLTVPGR